MVAGVIVLIAVLGMIVFNVDKINLSGEAVKKNVKSVASSSMAPSSIGVYNSVDDTFVLSNSIATPNQDVVISFGQGNKRLFGDWDGDGVDTIGYYVPSATLNEGTFYLSNSNYNPNTDITFKLTNIGNHSLNSNDIPIAGDWDGDGADEIGLYRPVYSTFRLVRNTELTAGTGAVDTVITHGVNGDFPIMGDYDGDGVDVVGVYRPRISKFYIKQANDDSPINYDLGAASFSFGLAAGLDYGVVGDWDSDGKDEIGVYRRKDINGNPVSRFFLSYDDIAGRTTTPGISKQFDFGPSNFNNKAIGGVWINCDVDGDDYYSYQCGGNDCNDNDVGVYLGAVERCGNELIDDDCDGEVDEECDAVNCPDGFAKCDGFQPQRCVIDQNGQGSYVNEGLSCDVMGYSYCKTSSISMADAQNQIVRASCSSLLFLERNNIISSNLGMIVFPNRTTSNDFRTNCINLAYGYYKIDTTLCPNLTLLAGESMNISLFGHFINSHGKEQAALYDVNDDGVLEKCVDYLEICKNIEYVDDGVNFGLSYTIVQPTISRLKSRQELQSGSGGSNGGAGGSDYDCKEVESCCFNRCQMRSEECIGADGQGFGGRRVYYVLEKPNCFLLKRCEGQKPFCNDKQKCEVRGGRAVCVELAEPGPCPYGQFCVGNLRCLQDSGCPVPGSSGKKGICCPPGEKANYYCTGCCKPSECCTPFDKCPLGENCPQDPLARICGTDNLCDSNCPGGQHCGPCGISQSIRCHGINEP